MNASIATLLLLASSYAPAPAPKPPTTAQVKPGQHILVWNGGRWQMTLSPDANYEARTEFSRYYGAWSWCPKVRILVISETTDGRNWTTYTIRMPDLMKLEGKADDSIGSTVVIEAIAKRKGK